MMRLGLIGGMSWESTRLYYDLMNRLVRERLGGSHSAELLLWSFDFAPIVQVQRAGEWDRAAALLVEAARRLEQAGAQGLLICANTMHRMADQVQAAVAIPLIHVADVTAAAVRGGGASRPLLLATRYTMEQDFYRGRLALGGVDAVIPGGADRLRLQSIIYEELVRGVARQESKAELLRMVATAQAGSGADGVVLACTELGLLLAQDDLEAPVFDTTEIHARAGVEFALG
jgi:aspartate racemase